MLLVANVDNLELMTLLIQRQVFVAASYATTSTTVKWSTSLLRSYHFFMKWYEVTYFIGHRGIYVHSRQKYTVLVQGLSCYYYF